jgi:hypothetical protein
VGFIDSLLEAFDAEVRVNLSCGKALVPEQLLYRLEVRPSVK